MKFKWNGMFFYRLALAAILSGAAGCAEPTFSVVPGPSAPPAPPKPVPPLAWDAEHKEASPKSGQPNADFVFTVTNVSSSEAVINQALGSCSCTVAKLPSQPWHLPPQTTGDIHVTVNLAGKVGTFSKTVTVLASNLPPKILTVTVHMPVNPEAARARNMEIAKTDRQAVFKGECASCHAEKAKDQNGNAVMGKVLYKAVCDVCHEGHNGIQRASMVPDLHTINHPTDYNFWKEMIANGKPGTLMPAFSTKQGGPLTDAQIDSLAKVLVTALPYRPGLTNQPGAVRAQQLTKPVFPPISPKN